jgi:hypothetical protein
MHINPDKCEVIRITTKRKIILSSYFIHGKELKSDATPSTITLWVRPARKLLIQFKVGLQTQVLRKGRQFLLHWNIIVFTSLLRDRTVLG